MMNPCGCNWNLGMTCYLHRLYDDIERLERREKEEGLSADDRKYLAEKREAVAKQQALFDKARAEGRV